MKKLIILSALVLACTPALGIEYEDVIAPKEPAYRVGTTNDVETHYDSKALIKTETVRSNENTVDIEKLTYADLSIKKISKEVSKEIELDYDIMLSDLSLLWQGAATRSDTVKFALYKLANPDTDKPDEKSIKKVLSTIASMSTLIGAGMGSPIMASGAFIGGNVLGIMSQDDKALNYKYTKVNDADMIILVRKVSQLQQNVVNAYYDYLTSRKVFDMSAKMTKLRQQNYQLSQNGSRELILITDAYYREALDTQTKARNEFYAKRSSLQQLVGTDIFKQFETNVNARDSEE